MADISYEVQLQQEKLGEIIFAINRENKQLQDKQKEKSDLEKEIFAIGAVRDNKLTELEGAKQTMKQYTLDRQQEIDELSQTKYNALKEVNNLAIKKDTLIENINQSTIELDILVIAKKREKEQIEAEIKNIQSNAQLETTRLISLRDEAQQLTRQADQVKIRAEKELEVVEDKIKLKTGELNNLTIESIQRLNSMGDYAIQIKNYEDSKNILLEEIVELKIYLETIRTDISKQKEELEGLSKDIIAIRKEKIQVSQMRALLDRKEDFIKEKFADAGLVYK